MNNSYLGVSDFVPMNLPYPHAQHTVDRVYCMRLLVTHQRRKKAS